MPAYTFQSPHTGESYDIEFDGDPNEADLEEVRLDLEKRERDTGQGQFDAALSNVGRGALSVPKGIVGGVGEIAGLVPGLEDNPLQRGAKSFQESYEGALPVNPVLEDTFAQKAAGAAGQGAGMLATTLATAGLGATPAIARMAGLGTAGLMGAEQGGQTVEEYGVTDPLEKAAIVLGSAGLEAGTEMLGGVGSKNFTEALLGQMKSATRPGNIITRGLKTAGSEGLEEVIAGQGGDILTKAVVDEDPNRPGFAINGAPMPPDILSMKNLYNRLEEGALGAVGGTVFAGAEALGSQTPVNEALSLRMQARNVLDDLQSKETLTPEEQGQLAQVQAEDQNLSAWLERQGFDSVLPALEEIIANPETPETERTQATEYAALIDNLNAVEQAPDASPEEVQIAREAVDSHPLNNLNPLAKTRQNSAISGTIDEKIKALRTKVEAQSPVQKAQAAISTAMEETAAVAEVSDAPLTAQVLREAAQTPPTDVTPSETVDALLPTPPVQEQPSIPTTAPLETTVQPAPISPEQAPVPVQTGEVDPLPAPAVPAKPKLRKPKVRLGISVSPREVERAVKKFSKIGKVRVATVAELTKDPKIHSMFKTEEDFQNWVETGLRYSDGLSNDGTGTPVIIPENLVIYADDAARAVRLNEQRHNTTPGEEALIRVMMHENWHGIEIWIENDPSPEAKALQKRYYDILGQVSDEELDNLATRRYHNLSNWRNVPMDKRRLQSEVLAERREKAELTGEPDSLIEKFLAWLRDVYKAVVGTEENPTPDELQEIFDAWYRAQKTGTTPQAPIQSSQSEIPARPNIPVTYEDRGTGNTLDEVLDSLWRPFYSAWESGDQSVPLEQAWAEHISDPDFLFGEDVKLRIDKRNAGRNWVDFTPAASQTTPETGPKQTKRKGKTAEPTAEDIARRFPQASLPERTKEQLQDDLRDIRDQLSFATFHQEREGLDPTLATRMEREWADSGERVKLYRKSMTDIERRDLASREYNLLVSLSPDGPSQEFGDKLMAYLSGASSSLYGSEGNDLSKVNLINYLLSADMTRNQIGIDGMELKAVRSRYLTEGAHTLRSAAADRIYGPLRSIERKVEEVTEKAQKAEGVNPEEIVAQTTKDVTGAISEAAEQVVEPEVMDSVVEGATADMDFELAIESLPENERKAIRDLLNELEELDELLRMEAELTAGQTGPAASRAEIKGQKLTLEEVRSKISQKRKAITKLVEEIQKTKVEGDPVTAAREIKKRVRKPNATLPVENNRLRDWASGKLEVEGLGKPVKTIQKYIQVNGFNRDAFRTVLTNTFPEANPNFIFGIVNRIGDLLDGAATKEGIIEDLKKQGKSDDPKLVEKMVKIADKARLAREKAIQSMEKKLGKVKNPTPEKLKKRSKFVNLVQQALNSGILDTEAVNAAFAEAFDLHGLTPERIKEMGDLLQKIEALPDGILRDGFHRQWMQLLNELAPASSLAGMAFSAYMGYALQGFGTMLMQTSNLLNHLTPLAFAHNVGKIYATTKGSTWKKLVSSLNAQRNWRLATAGARESWDNLNLIPVGITGIKSGSGMGIGVSPTSLTQTPYETSLAWTPWGQWSKFRLQSGPLMRSMGVEKLFKATRLPAFIASRSFNVIRGAEAWSGGVEKNMAFRQIAAMELENQGKSSAEAWRMVEEALSPKTNAQMWQDAYKQADEEIASDAPVHKLARKQRATELVQDALDAKWDLMLKNRHRQQSALANFKTDPITPMGAGAYKLVSMALDPAKIGPFPNPFRFGFLFPRFFINSLEQSFSYSPAALLTSFGLPTELPDSKMKERQQRIVEIYGSLSNYRDARIGKSLAGTTVLAGVGMMMAAAMQMWDDDDDDEPPIFWLTGDVIGRWDKRGTLASTGWWAPNTMYFMGMKFNYVNASPQFAMILNAAGNLGDRFMFPKLLGEKLNPRTKQYEPSVAETWIRPLGEATAAPMSRSTYRLFYDAIDNALGGDPKKLIRLATQPATGTATALTLGVVPSLKTFEKAEKSRISPRSPQDVSQTLQAAVPFANTMGLDTGKPLYSVFGEKLTPYHFFTIGSNPQEVSPQAKQAGNILIDLGISKNPQKFEYLGDGVVEVAHEGKNYIIPPEKRDQMMKDIGESFAASVVREKARLQKLAKDKGKAAASDRVSTLATDARKRVLARFRPEKEKNGP